jgi:hypothetical protein
VRNDRTDLPATDADFEALVARIHQDLRKERRIRKWRQGAPDRRMTLLALLLLLVPLAIGLYLSGAI